MMDLVWNQQVFIGIFALGIVGMLPIIVMTFKRLSKHLQANHPEIWKSLGRPNDLAPPHVSTMAVVYYVVCFRHRDANDPALKTMGNYLFLFAFTIIADIYGIFFALVHPRLFQ